VISTLRTVSAPMPATANGRTHALARPT